MCTHNKQCIKIYALFPLEDVNTAKMKWGLQKKNLVGIKTNLKATITNMILVLFKDELCNLVPFLPIVWMMVTDTKTINFNGHWGLKWQSILLLHCMHGWHQWWLPLTCSMGCCVVSSYANLLTHWGRVPHIYVGKLYYQVSDNGLSPVWQQQSVRAYCLWGHWEHFSTKWNQTMKAKYNNLQSGKFILKWRLQNVGTSRVRQTLRIR